MNAATAEFDATMAFATPDIAAGRIRPLFVLRHPKTGMWYLLPSIQVPTTAAEEMVTLGEIAKGDEALRELAALHAGQAARRSSASSPWRGVQLSQPLSAATSSSSSSSSTSSKSASAKGTSANGASSKNTQLGAGHDPEVQRLERLRARFAGLAMFWLTIPGIIIILAGLFAVIGLDLGKHETLGFSSAQVIGAGLLAIGVWFVAFGLAAGAAVRARWLAIASLLPFVLGGLTGAWGRVWLGVPAPDAGPVWFGVSVWWAVTQPVAITLLLIALLCWIAAFGVRVCDRKLRRVDGGA